MLIPNPSHRRSPRNLTLNDIYENWYGGYGVLSSLSGAPWYAEVDPVGLDLAYHGVRSGEKFAANILYHFIDTNGHITELGTAAVMKMLIAKYGQKWDHLWELYSAEYNPLHSYSLSEMISETLEGADTTSIETDETSNRDSSVAETQSHSNTESANWTETESVDGETTGNHSDTRQTAPNITERVTEDSVVVVDGAVVRTPNLQDRTVLDETVESTGTEEDETVHGHIVTTETEDNKEATLSVYGFNSSAAVPKDTQSETDTGESTVTNSGTDTETKDTSATTDRDSTSTTNRTGTETTTDDTTTETDTFKTTTKTGTETETAYGLNSETESTDRETTGSSGGNDYGMNEINRTVDDDVTKESTQNTEFETSRERTETRSKSGNVFKSPGELLSIDRDFWLTEYFDIVFADIDSLLALSVFSDSPVRQKVY